MKREEYFETIEGYTNFLVSELKSALNSIEEAKKRGIKGYSLFNITKNNLKNIGEINILVHKVYTSHKKFE